MFDNLKNSVFGFGSGLSSKLTDFFSRTADLNDKAINELEYCLLSGDLGPQVTQRLLTSIKESKLRPQEALVDAIKKILERRNKPLTLDPEMDKPFPILIYDYL